MLLCRKLKKVLPNPFAPFVSSIIICLAICLKSLQFLNVLEVRYYWELKSRRGIFQDGYGYFYHLCSSFLDQLSLHRIFVQERNLETKCNDLNLSRVTGFLNRPSKNHHYARVYVKRNNCFQSWLLWTRVLVADAVEVPPLVRWQWFPRPLITGDYQRWLSIFHCVRWLRHD